MNFITEVFNLTRDYLNEEEELLNKDEMNDLVKDFMDVYREGPRTRIADAFERDLLVYIKSFDEAVIKKCEIAA